MHGDMRELSHSSVKGESPKKYSILRFLVGRNVPTVTQFLQLVTDSVKKDLKSVIILDIR